MLPLPLADGHPLGNSGRKSTLGRYLRGILVVDRPNPHRSLDGQRLAHGSGVAESEREGTYASAEFSIIRNPPPAGRSSPGSHKAFDRHGIVTTKSHRPRHTLVVFPLPSQFPDAQQIGVRTLRRDDAAVHLHPSPGNLRKVLWSATVLPQTLPGATPEAPALVRIAQIQGHVLCLREDSHCFRLTWLCESSASARVIGDAADSEWDASAGSICLDASSSLVTFLRPGEWQDCHSHRYSGHLLGDHTAPPQFQPLREAGLRVASEARVRLSSILRDMLRRRPKLVAPPHSPDRLPLFSCDLVEVGHGGISLQVVICFDSGKHAIYAVFVEIHVMRQSYRELHWTRRDTRSTSEPLDTVAEILSANRRMSQQRLGPYRARPEPLQGWTGLCTARSVEPDEWTACHAPVVPDKVPWDALYPDAQVFDNRAVLLQAPVQSLRARSVPVELVYG